MEEKLCFITQKKIKTLNSLYQTSATLKALYALCPLGAQLSAEHTKLLPSAFYL